MLKLRLRWPASTIAPWTLTEAEFIHEFGELSASGWANLPPGPVVVHGVDEQDRVAWTGHYTRGVELSRLLRQLLEEREIRMRTAHGVSRRSG